MRTVADVVVVGAGATGASAAFHLARLRGPRVIVVEKGSIASGMTKRSGGLVRTNYRLKAEARLALASLHEFQNWKDLVGGDCGFVQTGLVNVVNGESASRDVSAHVAMLRQIGANVQLLSSNGLRDLEPAALVDEVSFAAYEPEAGYADPILMTRSLATAGKALGVVFQTGTFVRRILVERGRVTGVDTNTGPIEALTVIVAAGPWTDRLLVPLSASIGIRPEWAQVAFFERPPALKAGHVAFWDAGAGVFFRPHAYGLTLGGLSGWKPELKVNPDQFEETVEPSYVAEVQRRIAARLPPMSCARYVRGHTGIYDMSPDGHAVIDHVPGVHGLIVAAGFSGSGSALAPAAGVCLAEMVTEGTAGSIDLRELGFGRLTPSDQQGSPEA